MSGEGTQQGELRMPRNTRTAGYCTGHCPLGTPTARSLQRVLRRDLQPVLLRIHGMESYKHNTARAVTGPRSHFPAVTTGLGHPKKFLSQQNGKIHKVETLETSI